MPDPEIALLDAGAVLHTIEIGATFLTGIEVDAAGSSIDRRVEGPGLRLERNSQIPFAPRQAGTPHANRFFYGVDAPEHGTDVIPRILAAVDPVWLLANCNLETKPIGWELIAVECDVHDFGVGMVVLRWRPAIATDLATDKLEAVLAELTSASKLAVKDLTSRIAHACMVALRDDPARLELSHGLDLENVAVLPPAGDVLWMWHLVMVSCSAVDRPAVVRRVASTVCPNDFETLILRDHTFAAGVHASVVCSTTGREGDAEFIAKAPRTQDAWWTLFWRLDRVLLALQLRLEANLTTQALTELQSRAVVLSDVSTRVSLLRSRLDSLLVSSGARDIQAWEVLADAWDLPYRIESVDRKLVLLSRAYGEVLTQISSCKSARVNFMIYVFTAFSLVASVVAVADFAQGSTDAGAVVRLLTILGSVLGALAAVLLSVRTTRAIRRRNAA